MLVVFDTNILVSAMLTPGGNASTAIRLWRADRFSIATSDYVIAEYEEVLSRDKFKRTRGIGQAILEPFLINQPRIAPTRRIAICDHESAIGSWSAPKLLKRISS
jgi:putative PIN family toxin of toxin-antitoxin system